MKTVCNFRPAVLSLLLLSGCASTPPGYLGVPSDPWIGAQRLPPAPVRRADELYPASADMREDVLQVWDDGTSYEAPQAALRVSDPSTGAICSGGWDAASPARLVDVRLACDDGRTGRVLFRPSDGWGDVRLSDSTRQATTFRTDGSGTLPSRTVFEAAKKPRRPVDRVAHSLPPVVPATVPAPVVPSTSTAPTTPVAAPSFEPAPTPSVVRPAAPDRPAAPRSGYKGNCATPDDLDSAGRRCGRRSAASRPGGYGG